MALQQGSSVALSFAAGTIADAVATGATTVTTDTTSNIVDYLIQVELPCGTGTPLDPKQVEVYCVGSEDGTDWPTETATASPGYGSQGTVTIGSPTNARLLGVISFTHTTGFTARSQPMSLAAAFGGIPPRKWQVIVRNETGLTSTAAPSGSYTPLYYN